MDKFNHISELLKSIKALQKKHEALMHNNIGDNITRTGTLKQRT